MWLVGLVAGVAAYAIAGFLIAPRAIKFWIESTSVSGSGCRLSVQQVYVNPFTMFVSFKNATLFEQESKLLVSTDDAATKAWTMARFRAGTAGRDVAIHGLAVTSTAGGPPLISAPRAFFTNVEIDADGGFVSAAHARLERPDIALTHDAAGVRQQPAWLSLPDSERVGNCVSLNGVEVVGGKLRITDEAVTPPVQLKLHDVVAGARQRIEAGAVVTDIDVEARIGDVGTVSLEALLSRPAVRHPDRFSMTARNIDLEPLSPYARRIFGRDILAGVADVTLHHERHNTDLHLDDHLTMTGLELDEPDTNSAHETLPLELAIALATDAADRSDFLIQSAVHDAPSHTIASVFADSFAAHLTDLAAAPFSVLNELAGAPDAVLDAVPFLPGSAEMAPTATNTLVLLADALGQRPRLELRVHPGYDPAADRNAIAAQQIKLHIALATSAGGREGRVAAIPDFADPKVRDILDEFAGARLSESQRRAMAGNAGDVTTTYRDIYRALVANERVSETVLKRLASFRARSVIDALEREGIDRKRLRMADARDVTVTDDETVLLKVAVDRVGPDGQPR